MKNLTTNQIVTLLMIHHSFGVPGKTYIKDTVVLYKRELITNANKNAELELTAKGEKLVKMIKALTELF